MSDQISTYSYLYNLPFGAVDEHGRLWRMGMVPVYADPSTGDELIGTVTAVGANGVVTVRLGETHEAKRQ